MTLSPGFRETSRVDTTVKPNPISVKRLSSVVHPQLSTHRGSSSSFWNASREAQSRCERCISRSSILPDADDGSRVGTTRNRLVLRGKSSDNSQRFSTFLQNAVGIGFNNAAPQQRPRLRNFKMPKIAHLKATSRSAASDFGNRPRFLQESA